MKVRNMLFLIAAALLLCTAVSAAEYTDVADTHWAYKQIDYLSAEITGYPDGTYKPEHPVTRAEFVTLFARLAFPDEYEAADHSTDWWKPAYDICIAHNLLSGSKGHKDAMPRGDIATLLGRFCAGWGGIQERADAAMQLTINWNEQRMESPEQLPLYSDTIYHDYLCICANQGLLNGYPDGSFKPEKTVTRAEAAAVLARLKAQLTMREKGYEYVCTVGDTWLMQYTLADSVGLGLYEPLTGKPVRTIGTWEKALEEDGFSVENRLLTGSDGLYVWGRAGLFKRSGSTLEQLIFKPVIDICWSGDTLYFLSYDVQQPAPTYLCAAVYCPCATQVWKMENTEAAAKLTLVAERDPENSMQNLTDLYMKNGEIYVVGTYCMGMADLHGALYAIKDGTLTALFGEN